MRRLRVLLWLGLAGLLLAGYFVLGSFGVLPVASAVRAREVPPGDQEIAFLQAATSGASWERFVAGIHRVQKDHPGLIVEDRKAFPEQSAEIPEVALGFAGTQGKLRIRWYKLTSAAGIEHWVSELARRNPAPLAVIGGGSSDRARDLAGALAREQSWHGAAPLLLITTATADNIYPGELVPFPMSLMKLYEGRSYRFCFTNSQMAESMWDFVWSRDDLRPITSHYPLFPSGIAQIIGGDFWGSLPFFVWGDVELQPFLIHIVQWLDDPYSRDLANQFSSLFAQPDNFPLLVNRFSVPYSVGGLLTPNPREEVAVQSLIDLVRPWPNSRFLLILPAVDRPVRRFLRSLALAAPQQLNNLVVVTGDSISFTTIYQNRNIAWNIQELPVPLVAFCHHNPVAGQEVKPGAVSGQRTEKPAPPALIGTDEELLNADIVRLLVESAFCMEPADPAPSVLPLSSGGEKGGAKGPKGMSPGTVLLADSDALNEQVKRRRSHYFAPDGNRKGGSGEYIVVLMPHFKGGHVLPEATLEVWVRRTKQPTFSLWERIQKFDIDYGESAPKVKHGAS
jgi:hypothetical protein